MMKDQISQFLEHNIIYKQYSASTVKRYRLHLNDFYRFLLYNNVQSRSEVTIPIYTQYIIKLRERKLNNKARYYRENITISDATVSVYNNSIIAFYRWYSVFIDPNALDRKKIPPIRVTKPMVGYMKENEILEFLKIPEVVERRADIALRNKLYIFMLYITGCRASELLGLKVSDVNRESKTITILGKGKKLRVVFVTDRVLDILDDYLEQRKKDYVNSLGMIFKPKESEYLFTALDDINHGRPIAYVSIMNMFKRYSKYHHRKIHAHMLRHSHATTLINSGVDIFYIKEDMGHANISTTQRYLHVDNVKLKEIHNKVFG